MLARGPLHVDQGGVAAVDQVLGGEQAPVRQPGVDAGQGLRCRALVAGMVATSVMTLGPSSAQVSVTWARYPVQRVTWPRRA